MIENLLTEQEQDITDGASGWTAGTNCAVSRSTVYYRVEPASLLVAPTTVGGATMTVDLARLVPITPGATYRVFCSARNGTPGSTVGIQPLIYDSSGTTELEAGQHRETATTVFGRWVTVISEFTAPIGAVSLKVRLDSEAVTGGTWFDTIAVVEWNDRTDNVFLNLVTRSLPAFMRDADLELTSPDRPLTRFIDLVAVTGNNILTSTLAFDYISPVDGISGYDKSTLVQPEYYPAPYIADASWLPWLAQLVGVRAVYPTSGGSLTPWFWFEDNYETWNGLQAVDPAVNPAFPISSLSRNGTTGIVTATYGAQSAGPAYTPVVGDPVEVTGTTGFNGGFILLTVNTGTSTLTWSDPGSTASAGAAGTITYSDVSWTELEAANPTAFDSLVALKHLTRTASTGINAGSAAAMVNAARAVLDGEDLRATASRSSNTITITTEQPHTFDTGDYIRICESSIPTLNLVSTATVVDTHTITISSSGPDTDSTTVYITNKQVALTETTAWEWTVTTSSDQTYAADLLETVVNQAKPAGVLVTFVTT